MNPHESITRRTALKTLGTGAALLSLGAVPRSQAAVDKATGGGTAPYELPKLAYAYDALEPHIDARTMEIHHSKHHQAYINNANKVLADHAALGRRTAEELLRDLNSVPESVRPTLRNNVGGHVNHTFFWEVIGPRAGGEPRGDLADGIDRAFGSFDALKTQFNDAAAKRFGSGWGWLVVKDGQLSVRSTPNQDSPLSEGAVPVLGVDVWEHAYYLHYQNRRADYLAAFWNIVNWDRVAANYAQAKKAGT